VSRIVDPVVAIDMVVGVEAVGLVAYGEAEPNGVLGNGVGDLVCRATCVAPCLEAIAIPFAGKIRRISIVERPAVVESGGLMRVDAIVAVVAVEPGAASPEDISFAACGRVAAEAVGVAAAVVLGVVVEVAVGVAVEDEVVRAFEEIEADGHAIVHAQSFVDIVTPVVFEAFRLCMSADRDLDAGYFEAFEVDPGACYVEGGYAEISGFYRL